MISILIALLSVTAGADGTNNTANDVQYSKTENKISLVRDLDANTKPYTYFNLDSAQEVSGHESETNDWDIAFSKTTIIVNGGVHGAAFVAAQILEQPFELIKQAPTDGYTTDTEKGNAIQAGSGNSWYQYDMAIHAIRPITGRTIMLKTSEGKYAKIEIINYYKGAPEEIPTEESAFYTFRYSLSDINGAF